MMTISFCDISDLNFKKPMTPVNMHT